MPALMSFSATTPLDRLGLLGHPDRAHAAFADLLQQLVRADGGAGTFGQGLLDSGANAVAGGGGGKGRHRLVEQTLGCVVGGEHQAEVLTQTGVGGTFAFQPGGAVFRRDFQDSQE